MGRRFVDISMPLENDAVSDPAAFAPKISYFDRQQTYAQMAPFFPGLQQADLPGGEAWAIEKVELITHNGTHLDAPYHFHSTMNRGERAIAIDDAKYRTEMALVAAGWLLRGLGHRLEGALLGDDNWGISTIRSRLLWYLEATIAMCEDADALPGLRSSARSWLADLRRSWPATMPLAVYPAFAVNPA